MNTYPMRIWDYNHIIGFMNINIDGQDVMLDVYLPETQLERYHWDSKVKHFVVNQMSPNNHVYIGNKSSDEIRKEITGYLDSFCERMSKRGYFVDTDAFHRLNKYVDYRAIYEEEA